MSAETVNGMPIVARCTKCGRGFLTLPQPPLIDRYAPQRQGHLRRLRWNEAPGSECGGEVVLISPPPKPRGGYTHGKRKDEKE